MNLAHTLIFIITAALMFRMTRLTYSKIEKALWIFSGIGFTLSASIYFVLFIMELQ